jgi:hypothetical protein
VRGSTEGNKGNEERRGGAVFEVDQPKVVRRMGLPSLIPDFLFFVSFVAFC